MVPHRPLAGWLPACLPASQPCKQAGRQASQASQARQQSCSPVVISPVVMGRPGWPATRGRSYTRILQLYYIILHNIMHDILNVQYKYYRSHVNAYASILPGPPHSFSRLSPSHGEVAAIHSDFGRASALAAAPERSLVAPQKQ